MRLEAEEWRLLMSIQAKPQFCAAILARAIEARDCARDLHKARQKFMQKEMGF